MKPFNKYGSIALIIIGVATVLYFSTKNLTESPPIWMDEGIIIQTARNFSNSGYFGIRIDPETVVSAGFVTTSYPVTFPISVMFSKYGINILNARIIMVVYILLLISVVIFWLKTTFKINNWNLALSLFLIATFPPLYGHGKNVLGEIPGLFYLFSGMVSMQYAYRLLSDKSSPYWKKILSVSICTLFIGLTIVTKPVFIPLIPAVLIILFLYILKKKLYKIIISKENLLIICLGIVIFLLPIVIWLSVQFHSETLKNILSIYANPHNFNIFESIFSNLKRFVTEGQPFYTMVLFVLWTATLIVKRMKRESLKISEIVLYLFSAFILIAYLRTVGYFRYFFLAEFIALTMCVLNLRYIFNKKIGTIFGSVICVALIVLQGYGLVYSGWTAKYNESNQTKLLEDYFNKIDPSKEIFIYQAPELVTFIKNENYSQFMDITSTIQVGIKSLERLNMGLADIVAINNNTEIENLIGTIGRGQYESQLVIGKYRFFRKVSEIR